MKKIKEDQLITRICEVCGVKFTTSDINEYYCCEGCRIQANQEKSIKKLSNSIIGKLKMHSCKSCGKKFMSVNVEENYCSECEIST